MRILFCILLLASLSFAAQAQELDTYTGRANVDDQSANQRGRGLREALIQVLKRVTGDDTVGATPRGQGLLTQASQLALSIGYEEVQTPESPNQLQLVVNFDPAALESALKQNGLPVFGVFAGSLEDVPLSVSGLRSERDYARVMRYLRGQPGMKSLAVTRTENGNLQLLARIEGGAGRLAGALTVGNILKRDTTVANVIAYQLAPQFKP